MLLFFIFVFFVCLVVVVVVVVSVAGLVLCSMSRGSGLGGVVRVLKPD